MKALIISALLFFSVRAMSATATVGQDLKGECKDSPQSGRVAKPKIIVETSTEDVKKDKATVIAK